MRRGGVAEDRLGVTHRVLGDGRQHVGAGRGRERGRIAGDHPVVARPDQPADEDHAFLQRLERLAAQVGPGPVGELVHQVEQHQGVAVLAGDVKGALDDVPPAQQHVPLGVGQLGAGRDELLDHGGPRREPVLQQELVEDHGEQRLVGHHPAGEVPLENRRPLAVEPGRQGEVPQHRLEVSGPLHQIHVIPPAPGTDAYQRPYPGPATGAIAFTVRAQDRIHSTRQEGTVSTVVPGSANTRRTQSVRHAM